MYKNSYTRTREHTFYFGGLIIKVTILINYYHENPEFYQMYSGEKIEAEVYVKELFDSGYLVRRKNIFNYREELVARKCNKCNHFYTIDDFSFSSADKHFKCPTCRYCNNEASFSYRKSNYLKLVKYRERNRHNYSKYYSKANTVRQSRISENFNPDYMEAFLKTPRKCDITGIEGGGSNICIEHINPVAKSEWGSNKGNIMWLLKPLNSSKAAKNVFSWIDAMTQDKLDYLLRGYDLQLNLSEFRNKYYEVLTEKAAERGLTLAEYKTEYNKSYYKQ